MPTFQLNDYIRELWLNNWLVLVILPLIMLVMLIRVPEKWAFQDMNSPCDRKTPLFLFLIQAFIVHPISHSLSLFSIKPTLPALMFLAVGADILLTKHLSSASTVVITIALIAYHFQKILDDADEFEFAKIFKWKRKGTLSPEQLAEVEKIAKVAGTEAAREQAAVIAGDTAMGIAEEIEAMQKRPPGSDGSECTPRSV